MVTAKLLGLWYCLHHNVLDLTCSLHMTPTAAVISFCTGFGIDGHLSVIRKQTHWIMELSTKPCNLASDP